MKFSISDEQLKKITEWEKKQDEIVIEKQKNSHSVIEKESAESGLPYYGAIGGSLTYSFTSTSLGQVLKVTHNYTKETIDVTEYDMW
jgi:hypothetical protein